LPFDKEHAVNTSLFDIWKQVNPKPVHSLLQKERQTYRGKFVVLDDDPTGTQTVHDVFVITDWEETSIRNCFLDSRPLFFILTNSRALQESQTKELHTLIARRLWKVSQETGIPYIIISRSDSTLRGHFPLEIDTLTQESAKEGTPIDGVLLIPFFKGGGRYTVNDIQYIRTGVTLLPVGESEFAKDKTFGYHASDLKEWCEEKTKGRVKAKDVLSISLDEIRELDYQGIEDKLLNAYHCRIIIVNAIEDTDLEVFAIAFFRAVAQGKCFIFRSAASLVKVLAGAEERPLLTHDDLIAPSETIGGVVLVGSHVPKTTRQLQVLLRSQMVTGIEFNQYRVLEKGGLEDEVRTTTRLVESLIRAGNNVAVFTKRKRLDSDTGDPDKQLEISVKISNALVDVIGTLQVRPGFIVAKGGITSSDVATKALHIKKAMVMGQVIAGVPVWLSGEESKFPNLPYVIFPGNVGDDEALANVVESFTQLGEDLDS
jgi:uncharacterized protein YgbK (DUF1537 family)